MKTIDLVVPCYNEEEGLEHLFDHSHELTPKEKEIWMLSKKGFCIIRRRIRYYYEKKKICIVIYVNGNDNFCLWESNNAGRSG